jgi:hypothetical protein
MPGQHWHYAYARTLPCYLTLTERLALDQRVSHRSGSPPGADCTRRLLEVRDHADQQERLAIVAAGVPLRFGQAGRAPRTDSSSPLTMIATRRMV